MKLLLVRSLTIDRHALERIMQAAMFYADTVTIRAGATAADGDSLVERRINELIDLAAVGTWAHEYEVDRRGRVVAWGSHAILRDRSPDTVVPVETTRALVSEIDSELSFSPRALTLPKQEELRQGVAEIVQFRHSMSILRMLDVLEVDGAITSHRDRSHLLSSIQSVVRPTDQREAIVREVVSRCSFGPLSGLPAKVIAECRRETSRFGALLESFVDQVSGEVSPESLANTILSEYRRVVRANAPARPDPGGAVWEVVGAVLPKAVVIKMLGRRLEWFKHRGRARPFMLLGKLQHYRANQ